MMNCWLYPSGGVGSAEVTLAMTMVLCGGMRRLLLYRIAMQRHLQHRLAKRMVGLGKGLKFRVEGCCQVVDLDSGGMEHHCVVHEEDWKVMDWEITVWRDD